MENVKLIAIDLDGTLLNSKKEIPDGFFDYVRSHKDMHFCLSSGRQYYKLYKDFEAIGDNLTYIADNGAFVFDGKKPLFHKTMSAETALSILNKIEGIDNFVPIVCGLKSAYIPKIEDLDIKFARMYYERLEPVSDIKSTVYDDDIGKIALYVKNLKAPEEIKKLPKMPEGLEAVVSGKDWIDVSIKEVCKGEGIKGLQKIFGLTKDNCMCFGDFMNDYSMYQYCKYGIAMGNACDEVKKAAYYITKSNDENGVMYVLENMDKII